MSNLKGVKCQYFWSGNIAPPTHTQREKQTNKQKTHFCNAHTLIKIHGNIYTFQKV